MSLIDSKEITEEDLYFNFSASIRIFGENLNFKKITDNLQIAPSHSHKKGDIKKRNGKIIGKPYEQDMWLYKSPVNETEPLDIHLQTLWSKLKPNKYKIIEMKKKYNINIFCGYRSNCDNAGFDVSYESLTIFCELETAFSMSVIII